MTLMKLWECDMEMFHNEDRDSDIIPAWMDPDNPLTARTQRNVSEVISSPNIGVITSSPDLQWFLQSSIFSQPESNLESFSALMPTSMCDCCSLSCSAGAGKHNDMSSEELERIRIRRERNKTAAARCHDHRRVLTDTLQSETRHLEDVNSKLEEEISVLEREREKQKLLFEAHKPICKLKDPNSE